MLQTLKTMPIKTLGKTLLTAAATLATLMLAGCESSPFALQEIPEVDKYCLTAQKIITRTEVPMELVVHNNFEAFVKSKAVIEGPTIQQYNWKAEDGMVLGISCKLKSSDHLNLVFGGGSAGPDSLCQYMNQAVFRLLARQVTSPAFTRVVFDPSETLDRDEEEPGMTGPEWLAPFTMTYIEEGGLHIATKGFVVDFLDPQYADVPERFRGVHYCHLVAPEYLQALMSGEAEADVIIGREVDRSGPPPGGH
jgi:hypothetical protein